jgi:cation/acetate symporter
MHQPQSEAHRGGVRPRPWAAAFTIACATLLTFALPVVAPTLNAISLAGLPLGYYFAAQAGLILVALLGLWLSGPWNNAPRSQRLAAFAAAWVADGRWLTAGLVLTLIGGLFVYGQDGLPLLLGLGAGLLVSLVFIAPALDRAGALHVDDLLGRLTGSRAAAMAAALGVTAGLIMLLSIEVEVFSLAVATLAPHRADATTLVAAAAGVAVLLSMLPGRRFRSALSALALVTIAAGVWMLIWAYSDAGLRSLLPQTVYGEALAQLTATERTLLAEGLADPVSMPPFVRPFVQVSWLNFVALTLNMLLGATVLPHLLWRRTAPARSSHSGDDDQSPFAFPSRYKGAFGLAVAAALLTALPAVAVLAKAELYKAISVGVPIASEQPQWMQAAQRAGFLKVCPNGSVAEASGNQSASGASPSDCGDAMGRIRISDLALNPAATVLMMPALGDMAPRWSLMLASAVALLALWAAAATLRMGAEAATGWLGRSAARQTEGTPVVTQAPIALILPAALMLASLAAAAVVVLDESPVNRIYWAFGLFGSCVFPMLLLSALMRRSNGWALALGGLTGLAVCLYYVIGTTSIFAPQFALYWSSVSDAPPWLLEELTTLLGECAADADANLSACRGALDLGRELANWFGIDGRAGAVLGAPVGLLVAIFASLLSPSFWRRS